MGMRLGPWRLGEHSLSISSSCPGRAAAPRSALVKYSVCSNVSVSEELTRVADKHRSGISAISPAPAVDPSVSRGLVAASSPLCLRPECTALVTPARLAALSDALHLPVKAVQDIAQVKPQLLSIPPERLADAQAALRQELGLSARAARQLILREPSMAIELPIARLRTRAQQLAQLLSLPVKEITKSASQIPSILVRDPDVVANQLQRVAQALGIKKILTMLRLATAAPQFLTETPAVLAARVETFAAVLRRPANLVVRVLPDQPDLLFMTPRILRNKLAVLQSIFDRHSRLVVPIALACPQLLRCDLDAVRAAYSVLRPISGKDADFTFGMVCHAPHLLLEHPHMLARQARHVHRTARLVAYWQRQLERLSPAQMADLLGQSAPTYARLHFLVQTNQAGSIALIDALKMSQSDFLARYPDAESVKHAVRLNVPLAPIPRWEPPSNNQRREVDHATQPAARTRRRVRQTQSASSAAAAAPPRSPLTDIRLHDDSLQGSGTVHYHPSHVKDHSWGAHGVFSHTHVSEDRLQHHAVGDAQGAEWHEAPLAQGMQQVSSATGSGVGQEGSPGAWWTGAGDGSGQEQLVHQRTSCHSPTQQDVIEVHSPGRPHSSSSAAESDTTTHGNSTHEQISNSAHHSAHHAAHHAHAHAHAHANGQSKQHRQPHVFVHVLGDMSGAFTDPMTATHVESGKAVRGHREVSVSGSEPERLVTRARVAGGTRRDTQLVVSHNNGLSTVIEGPREEEDIEVMSLGQQMSPGSGRGRGRQPSHTAQQRDVMQCAAT